ncbi:MAG: trypsin-like peptidase domain-containing protein [Thermodesulfobacteriota bacterium]
MYGNPPRRRISSLVILLILLGFFWLIFYRDNRRMTDPEAEPRVVTARGDLADDERNTIDVFQRVSPSVVFITNVELRRNLFSLNVYEIPQGTGSGFIWDREGRVVTNYHVIEGASRVEVSMADGSTWKALVVGVAPDKDIAVLHISAPSEKLRVIPLGESSRLLVGQKVFAIGNPFGLDQTMTSGIVSALGREITAVTGRTIQDVIQTDAAINPGNSGGPLLDSAGRLIGINTAIYSPSGGSAGIGFAVPVDTVNRVVPEIIRYGRVIRPGIGVMVANENISRRLGLEGVLIISVQPGSRAAVAGLRGTRQVGGDIILGDVIQTVNGVAVVDYNDFRNQLDRYKVGDEVRLGILRDNEMISVVVQLEEVN